MTTFKTIAILTLLTLGLLSFNLNQSKPLKERTKKTEKINGISLVGASKLITEYDLESIKNLHANWITVMPFAFVSKGSAKVKFNTNFQWVGEKRKGIIEMIKQAKKNKIKVMLKPHVWMPHMWVGDLAFDSEKDWKIFEDSYTDYIMEFASIADSMKVEIFSIGVEVKKSVILRPKFWSKLIDKLRTVYHGKLTYAANWDNYKNISFWDKLDYIGIDAYFPVAQEKTPTYEACFAGWLNNYNAIKNLSLTKHKKIIFTEFGYRNIDYTGREPWNEASNTTYNSIAQENAYKALFARFWTEPWFMGGFLWKWFPNHKSSGGLKNNRFTPQNKPVEKIIRIAFKLSGPRV